MKVQNNYKNFLLLITFVCMTVAVLLPSVAVYAGQDSGSKSTEERFLDNKNGTVTDKTTGLMWATKDNGADIDWHDADKFCKSYTAGGYTDWRLPTLEELKNIYDADQKKSGKYGLTSLIALSNCCSWSSIVNLNAAAVFSFKTGNKPWSFLDDDYQLRALPVRGGEGNTESPQSKSFSGR